MKRYYLCDLIGDGSMGNPFRPSVADEGVNHVTVFPPQDMRTGQYQGTRCLVLIDTVNHARLMRDPRNRVLPEFPLDGKLNAMRTDTNNAMNAMLQAQGFLVNWQSSAGYREVIRGIGRQLDPAFHEDAFDVSE